MLAWNTEECCGIGLMIFSGLVLKLKNHCFKEKFQCPADLLNALLLVPLVTAFWRSHHSGGETVLHTCCAASANDKFLCVNVENKFSSLSFRAVWLVSVKISIIMTF